MKRHHTMHGMGKYELIPGSGIYVPDAGELTQAAAGGALSQTTQTLATSSGVQAGAKAATGNALGNWIINNWKVVAAGTLVAAIGIAFIARKK